MKKPVMTGLVGVCIAVVAGGAIAAAAGKVVSEPGLVPYTVADGAIAKPLTTTPGDPVEGEKIVLGSKLGNCLACHSMPIKGAVDPGNVGPDLRGVGASPVGELRLRIVNPKLINPQTIMPAYYRVAGLNRVAPAFAGKPILTAQQVEDVLAFLVTLK